MWRGKIYKARYLQSFKIELTGIQSLRTDGWSEWNQDPLTYETGYLPASISEHSVADPFVAFQALHSNINPRHRRAIHIVVFGFLLKLFNGVHELRAVPTIHHIV